MSETREFDGPNWQDNPEEYKPPVRRSGSRLASRGSKAVIGTTSDGSKAIKSVAKVVWLSPINVDP